jgi:hypothetical protein
MPGKAGGDEDGGGGGLPRDVSDSPAARAGLSAD